MLCSNFTNFEIWILDSDLRLVIIMWFKDTLTYMLVQQWLVKTVFIRLYSPAHRFPWWYGQEKSSFSQYFPYTFPSLILWHKHFPQIQTPRPLQTGWSLCDLQFSEGNWSSSKWHLFSSHWKQLASRKVSSAHFLLGPLLPSHWQLQFLYMWILVVSLKPIGLIIA